MREYILKIKNKNSIQYTYWVLLWSKNGSLLGKIEKGAEDEIFCRKCKKT